MKKLEWITLTEAIQLYKEKKGIKISKFFLVNQIYDGKVDAIQTGSRLWLMKRADVLKVKKGRAGAPFGNKNNIYGRAGKKASGKNKA